MSRWPPASVDSTNQQQNQWLRLPSVQWPAGVQAQLPGHRCSAAAAQWDYMANAALGTPETVMLTVGSQLAGIAKFVATSGPCPLISAYLGSLAAQSVPPEGQSPGIQPLQSVSTRC